MHCAAYNGHAFEGASKQLLPSAASAHKRRARVAPGGGQAGTFLFRFCFVFVFLTLRGGSFKGVGFVCLFVFFLSLPPSQPQSLLQKEGGGGTGSGPRGTTELNSPRGGLRLPNLLRTTEGQVESGGR